MSWVEGVVVGATDLGDADRILRLLTPDEGRVSGVARRARSSRKRWAGVFDIGNRIRLRFGRGKRSLRSIAEAEVIAVPRRSREDLERVALLAYGCELCAALAPENHEAHKLYRLLTTWIGVLEGEGRPKSASRAALEAKALTFAGLAPQLVRCVRCGEPADDPIVFDPENGGVLHGHCGSGRALEARSATVLEGLRWTPLAETIELDLPGEARSVLADFVEYQLARGLRSRALVAELGL